MIVELQGIGPEGKRLSGEDPPAILDIEEWGAVRDAGPIRYEVVASRAGDTLVVRGALETDLKLQCSRCADSFDFRLREPDFECVRNVDPGAESEDLTGDIRETILLDFPNYPVCRADCKGLCPQCGANWNRARCRCRPPVGDRWAALGGLKID